MTQRTIRLAEAADRLDDLLDEYAAKLQAADPGTQSARALQRAANDIDQRGRGVAHLIDQHGTDATVTISGFDAGDYARAEDRVADLRADHDGSGGLPGATRNVWAATGLVDAPFVDAGAGYAERLDAVTDQPPGVVKWLEALINEESSVEGNWTPLSERLGATSPD